MRLTQMQRRSRAGVLFLIPWLIGIVFFFFVPICQSFWYSISDAEITEGGAEFIFRGFDQYQRFFIEDSLFVRTLATSIGDMLLTVVMIMFFSLFIANILVQEFRGRLLARTIFFMPFR